MPELTVRICGVALRLAAEDRRFVASARRRYRPFLTQARPDLSIELTLASRRLRPFRSEPRGVWDGRAGRVERHDLCFGDDSAGGRGVLRAARKRVLRAGTFALGYDARTTGFAGVKP